MCFASGNFLFSWMAETDEPLRLADIKALGGTKTDLDLIESQGLELFDASLMTDLQAFVGKLDFVPPSDFDTEEEEEDSEQEKEEIKQAVKEAAKVERKQEAVEQKPEPKVDQESIAKTKPAKSKKVVDPEPPKLLEIAQPWFDTVLPDIVADNIPNQTMQASAKDLWTAYRLEKASKSFTKSVLKNGTFSDRIAALTLLVSEDPVKNFDHLMQLITISKKKSHRESIVAINALKDLFTGILPTRKLDYFCDQQVSKSMDPSHLILLIFENELKVVYFQFIKVLQDQLSGLEHIKLKILGYVSDLLIDRPEQEDLLLSLLVNKLGDDRKIASQTAFVLTRVLNSHPNMKQVIVHEVERVMYRDHIQEKAQYYAITFLNQIILSAKDERVANTLIRVYFLAFESMVKKIQAADKTPEKAIAVKKKRHDPRKQQQQQPIVQLDAVHSRMMSAILVGINRAYPFCQLDPSTFQKHIDTLFSISHLGNFNTCIQALTLIFHVEKEAVSDRFYRALYETLLDMRLYDGKHAQYLNLVFRALKADPSRVRVQAFIKRIMQCITLAHVPLACAGLMMASELMEELKLWGMVTEPECDDEEGDVKQNAAGTSAERQGHYDGRKRDPLYANANTCNIWELSLLKLHFHPTVALYASKLVTGSACPKGDDPLLNHTMARFLDRFVNKAPRTAKKLHHGESLMQPRKNGSNMFQGGRSRNIATEQSSAETRPVDEVSFLIRDFYAEYESMRPQKKQKVQADQDAEAQEPVQGQDDDSEEDEVWKAMMRSANLKDELDGEDEDDESIGVDGDDEDESMMGDDDEPEDVEISDGEEKSDVDQEGSSDGEDMDAWANDISKEPMQASGDKPKKEPKLKRSIKKMQDNARKHGYSGTLADVGDTFASYEDYEQLVNLGKEET